MQPKVKIYRNGWSAMLEKGKGWWLVNVRTAAGEVYDNRRCDDYRNALDYYRAFSAIAKNGHQLTIYR